MDQQSRLSDQESMLWMTRRWEAWRKHGYQEGVQVVKGQHACHMLVFALVYDGCVLPPHCGREGEGVPKWI